MPQMAPLMWTTLFILFILMLLLAMIKISFSKKEMTSNLNNSNFLNSEQKKLNWKW